MVLTAHYTGDGVNGLEYFIEMMIGIIGDERAMSAAKARHGTMIAIGRR